MTDNIKPEHYRKGEIDLFESWYQLYTYDQWQAIMQSHAIKYIFRDKNDRAEDLDKAIYTLERLKEKEIEYRDGQVRSEDEVIDSAKYASLLKSLLSRGFEYIARDSEENLWAFNVKPVKFDTQWSGDLGDWIEPLNTYYFPEVKWTDNEPTKISDLLATYENGGENGK